MTLRVLVACECSGRVREAFAARGWEAWSADLLPGEISPRRTADKDRVGNNYPSEGQGGHYQGDVRDLFNWNHPVNWDRSAVERSTNTFLFEPAPRLWDLIIAHPPCDHLSYAGARWFRQKQADGRQAAGVAFFMEMVNSPSDLVAVENPHSIMQRPVAEGYAGPPAQVVQPWWFGDPYVKGIHLWLKGLPPLTATHELNDYGEPIQRAATGGGSWRTDTAHRRAMMNAYEDSEGRANRAKVRSRTFPGLARAMASQWGDFAERYYREQGRTYP